jgi:hypothetical protein
VVNYLRKNNLNEENFILTNSLEVSVHNHWLQFFLGLRQGRKNMKKEQDRGKLLTHSSQEGKKEESVNKSYLPKAHS